MEGNPILLFLIGYPFIAALMAYLVGRVNKKIRDYFVQASTIGECVGFVLLFPLTTSGVDMALTLPEVCGMGLRFTLDGFRVLYGLIITFMWMMTSLFSEEYMAHYRNRNRYYLFWLFTLGATVGVFLSADLYTTFLFFEIMSFTSYVWVAQEEKTESLQAGATYLAVAVIGGLVMLMGLFLLYQAAGTLKMDELLAACQASGKKAQITAAGICLLVGFGAKAGCFPLHIWLPKAHPVAPAPASALLSGILTKSGIFGVLVVTGNLFLHNISWGALILLLGVITMFWGAFLAIFSVNLKRTLACSSMSQIGFILVGIGMQCLLGEENGLAVRGTLLHMMNHSLIKLVLFMAAGVVYQNLHQLNLNDIRGFGRRKPFLHVTFLIGALGIAGVPFFNGYISKTLLHESIVEAGKLAGEGAFSQAVGLTAFMTAPIILTLVEWIFLISGGMTAAYMTKLYVCLFLSKNADEEKQNQFDHMKTGYIHKKGMFAIGVSAVLLPVLGLFPTLITERLGAMGESFMRFAGEAESVAYFGWESLKGGLISLTIGACLYVLVIRLWLERKRDQKPYSADVWPARLDLEESGYRPLLLKVLPAVFGFLCRICDSLTDSLLIFLRKTVYRESPIPHEREEGSIVTDMLGSIADFFHWLLNCTVRRKHPKKLIVSYRHKLANRWVMFHESNRLISRSLSFGLLLFCGGFIFTLIYLLFRN